MSKYRRVVSCFRQVFDPATCRTIWVSLAVAPAVLVLTSIAFALLMLTGSASSMRTWYHQRAMLAIAAKQYPTARICYAALLQKKPDDPAYRLGLATSLAGMGDGRAAGAIVRQLAPAEGLGYLPAHMLLAETLLTDGDGSPQTLAEAESHLLRVIKVQPKDPRANALLAAIYAKTDRWDLVRERLPLAGPAADELSMAAADQFAKRGQYNEAQVWARRATVFFASKIKAEPRVLSYRINCAQAHIMLREFAEAVEVLQLGWKEIKDPILQRAVGQACGIWLKSSGSMDAVRRLSLLEQGLEWDGQNSLLLQVLLDPDTVEAANGVLPSTQPVSGATVRSLSLCIAACRANKPDAAKSELGTAISLRSDLSVAVASNAACIWAYTKQPDASSSLLLSTALLQLRPNDPVAQRAHGLVLSRFGDKRESARLLQAILPVMPRDKAIHQALADDYDALGENGLAAFHRDLGRPDPAPQTQPATTAPARPSK